MSMAIESNSTIQRPEQMMAALPGSSLLIAKSMNFNLPIKLNRDNYIYWKALVMPNIRAIELEDFITRERQCPSKFVEVLFSNGVDKELVLNLEFSIWKRFDQFLLGWFLSTISEGLVGQVTECIMFSQQSMAKVLQLKQQLQGLKKGSNSINDYILKVKGIGDGLRSAGQVVSDRDLLLNVLNGLGHEYDPVVVLVSQQSGITLHEAQYMLMIHEQRIEHLNFIVSVDISPSANFVDNNGRRGVQNNNREGQNNGGRGQNNRGRRGKGKWNNNNGNRPTCQICSRICHTATQCYNRYDRNSNQQLNQPDFTNTQRAMHVILNLDLVLSQLIICPIMLHTLCQATLIHKASSKKFLAFTSGLLQSDISLHSLTRSCCRSVIVC
ncbi:hypothetical protein ACOSQ2_009250 [Xanthoceras sorbifolium]